ncbi:MAG: N-acetylmuramoyl-L-alanine amidase [Clostridiales bacterium]|nr:N-acetylmuramoyl-L-alanine amidase [Clostridiales bacterium]
MKRNFLCLFLAFALLLTGCTGSAAQSSSSEAEASSVGASSATEPEASVSADPEPEESASNLTPEQEADTSSDLTPEEAASSSDTAPEEDVSSSDTTPEESSETTPEEEPLVFTEVSETVWATADVNIRTGPGTDTEVVAVLSAGDSVNRTGYQEAWSQVNYQGAVRYISSRYLTTEEPEEPEEPETPAETTEPEETAEPAETVKPTETTGHIVAIDPGHQAKGNSDLEPIGPGATEKKAKVSTGTSGVSTGVAESALTLTVALQLKEALLAEGYQVVMTRESQDVNLSNAERAQIATDAGAEIFIRIHANGSEDSSVSGIETLSPSSVNPYVSALYEDSYRLSKLLVNELCAATGAKNRGVQTSDTMSGINWSTMPVSIVELGFMTNPTEDQLLNSADYQAKLVTGMVNAVNAYFGS